MEKQTYTCPECLDVEDVEFQVAHERICGWLMARHRRDVEDLLMHLFPVV